MFIRNAAVLCSVIALATPALAADILSTVRVASGLSNPIFVTAIPGDTSRMFVVEQGSGSSATIKILDLSTNTVSPTPFATISGIVAGGEQGLLGLAFDPDYANNGKFYVDVTAPGGAFGNGITQIRQYTAIGTPGTYLASGTANTATFNTLLTIDQPQTNHNGGWIAFNPKLTPSTPQYLYIATGDGGNADDVGTGHVAGGNAQSTNSLLGKILRIDTSGNAPASNPFASDGDPNTLAPIYAYGLRNPFRDSFDRATGELYLGDVGQGQREEVDVLPITQATAANFGWSLREGNIQTPTVGGPTPADYVAPIYDFDHSGGGLVAINGGYVYRGTALNGWQGTYFFGETYSGDISAFTYTGSPIGSAMDLTAMLAPTVPGQAINTIVSFGEDAQGELYIVDYDGEIYKIIAIPEPVSLSLLALAAPLLLRRRKPH